MSHRPDEPLDYAATGEPDGPLLPVSSNLPPHPPNASRTLGASAVAAMVLINVLWAASSVGAKTALHVVGPFTLAFLRFLPAGLILLALARSRPRVPMRDWPALLMLGGLGIALTYGLFYTGMEQTTATDASLLTACEPILIALAAGIFLGEQLSRRQWGGLLLGLIGVYLIAGQAQGNWIALLALGCESSVSVVSKRLVSRYPGLYVVALEMLVGTLLLTPWMLWEVTHRPAVALSATVIWQGVAGLLYLSLLCSAFAYGVWYYLLERFPVSALGAFILLQPVFGPIWGLLYGEALRPGSVLGGVLVILGILLTTLRFGSSRN